MNVRRTVVGAVTIVANLVVAPARAAEPGAAGTTVVASGRPTAPVHVVVVVDDAYDPELAEQVERAVVSRLRAGDVLTAHRADVSIDVAILPPPASGSDLAYSVAVRMADDAEATTYSCPACSVAALETEIAKTVEQRLPEIRAAIESRVAVERRAALAVPAPAVTDTLGEDLGPMPPSKRARRKEALLWAGGILTGAGAFTAILMVGVVASMRREQRTDGVMYTDRAYAGAYATIGIASGAALIGAGLLVGALAPRRTRPGSKRGRVALGGGPGAAIGLAGRF